MANVQGAHLSRTLRLLELVLLRGHIHVIPRLVGGEFYSDIALVFTVQITLALSANFLKHKCSVPNLFDKIANAYDQALLSRHITS